MVDVILPDLPSELPSRDQVLRIASHPFFKRADEGPDALRIWVSQELSITNQFGQELLWAASEISSLSDRAFLLMIALDEHGICGGVRVPGMGHPELLETLASSMGIDPGHALADLLPPTRVYRSQLSDRRCSVAEKVGALAVGGEGMALVEYSRIRVCFERSYPDAEYRAFLDANIDHDLEHVSLMMNLAASLEKADGRDGEQFRRAAARSVAQRVAYYDDLLGYCT